MRDDGTAWNENEDILCMEMLRRRDQNTTCISQRRHNDWNMLESQAQFKPGESGNSVATVRLLQYVTIILIVSFRSIFMPSALGVAILSTLRGHLRCVPFTVANMVRGFVTPKPRFTPLTSGFPGFPSKQTWPRPQIQNPLSLVHLRGKTKIDRKNCAKKKAKITNGDKR